MTEKQRKKKAIIVLRSRIPFPPTKVFKDRRKEASKKACRGRLNEPSFFFCARSIVNGATFSRLLLRQLGVDFKISEVVRNFAA